VDGGTSADGRRSAASQTDIGGGHIDNLLTVRQPGLLKVYSFFVVERQGERQHRMNDRAELVQKNSVFSLVDSAVNMTLSAFAAERRAAAPLLLGRR